MTSDQVVEALLKFPAIHVIETNNVAQLYREENGDVYLIEGGGESPHRMLTIPGSFETRRLAPNILGAQCKVEDGGCGCAEVIVLQPLQDASL